MAGYQRHQHGKPNPLCQRDPGLRIRDMDAEGVDVNLMLPSGWFGAWTTIEDVSLEMAMYGAYHRWMAQYCGTFPSRLKGVVLVSARDVKNSVAELKRCAKEAWPLAVFVYAPYQFPLDHPDLEPVWKAAAEHDLAIALHTFTVMPPYAPGGLDPGIISGCNVLRHIPGAASATWRGSSARESWTAIRIFASARSKRVMVGCLAWVNRLEEHTKLCPEALPRLQRSISEYVTGGRYFQSIEVSEGQAITQSVIDLLGPEILMFGSDYPHGESWFPVAVETVLGWRLREDHMRRLLWDNAVNITGAIPNEADDEAAPTTEAKKQGPRRSRGAQCLSRKDHGS